MFRFFPGPFFLDQLWLLSKLRVFLVDLAGGKFVSDHNMQPIVFYPLPEFAVSEFLPVDVAQAGYPCDAAAGSVTFSAKTGATIIPAARIEKPVTSFLVASILYPYRCWLEPRLHWFHRNVLRFGNVAVTKHSHF